MCPDLGLDCIVGVHSGWLLWWVCIVVGQHSGWCVYWLVCIVAALHSGFVCKVVCLHSGKFAWLLVCMVSIFVGCFGVHIGWFA